VAGYREARVTVGVGRGDPDAAVVASAEELRRAITNLVDNAVRHARTRVELAAVVSDGRVVLTVTDDGPGIPPADRERVFDRFTRLDDARDRDAGGRSSANWSAEPAGPSASATTRPSPVPRSGFPPPPDGGTDPISSAR
jgi:hypothetical protein